MIKPVTYYIVNSITFYRLFSAPLLIYLAVSLQLDWFKWLLAVSFFTDAIDGFLARGFRVSSIMGARVDSLADDLTVLSAVIGMVMFKPEFIKQEWFVFAGLLLLFVIQVGFAFARYKKMTGFHTYLAKISAILQGVFLLLFFFLPHPLYWMFYAAAIVTALDLLEEIILIQLLPDWKADVKGLYWVIRKE